VCIRNEFFFSKPLVESNFGLLELSLHLVVNVLDHLFEGLLNVRAVKCTCLNERHVALVGVFLRLFEADFPAVLKVRLVADEQDHNVLVCVVE